jgi:hypothetical protein
VIQLTPCLAVVRGPPLLEQRFDPRPHPLKVETMRVVCGDEQVELPRARRGRRAVRYRHYLRELAKKPQAVRQVGLALRGPARAADRLS